MDALHFLTKRNKAKQRKSKSGAWGRADPRKRELLASSRKSTQATRLEGNPEGGAQRGVRGVWGKDVRGKDVLRGVTGLRWVENQKTKQKEGWG